MKTLLSIVLLALVADVREAINQGDFKRAEALVEQYRKASGITPEGLEALSWLGRGALQAKNYDAADRYAQQTEQEAVKLLKKRPLDADKSLPTALGASIEVQGQVLAARGERDRAVMLLQDQLARYRTTSIRTRIQKNINLLSLEGKPAPALEIAEYIGPNKPQPLAKLHGRPVLVFLWAHWCADCKMQGPILDRLLNEFGNKGLTIVAPTQLYGTAEDGQEAAPSAEKQYIARVLAEKYPGLRSIPVPLSSETFKQYGVSTTPTLVLIDRAGIVRLYRPGRMTYEELTPHITRVM
jgi:thiol-disulfide isomerase/thioredoxin